MRDAAKDVHRQLAHAQQHVAEVSDVHQTLLDMSACVKLLVCYCSLRQTLSTIEALLLDRVAAIAQHSQLELLLQIDSAFVQAKALLSRIQTRFTLQQSPKQAQSSSLVDSFDALMQNDDDDIAETSLMLERVSRLLARLTVQIPHAVKPVALYWHPISHWLTHFDFVTGEFHLRTAHSGTAGFAEAVI